MNGERVCVYIPVEEYRELVRAQRDAELLKNAVAAGISYSDVCTLGLIFDLDKKSGE